MANRDSRKRTGQSLKEKRAKKRLKQVNRQVGERKQSLLSGAPR